MVVYNNILAGASGATGAAAGFKVERSLRFNNDDSAHLIRTPSSAGNVDTWTWSGWVKRSGLGFHTDFFSAVQNGQNATIIQFDNNDRLDFENFVGNSDKGRKITNEFFTDTGAWYHIVVAYDSTNSTADDRVKIYVNGSQITSFNYSTNPDSGQNTIVNSTNPHYLGVDKGFSNHYFDGYLADVNFVDGQALAATDFGEEDDNGVWQPKAYSGTYGTNGFHLDFSDNSNSGALGYDKAVTAPSLNPRGGMDVVTYSGNGGTQSIGGLGFKPGLIWAKTRNHAVDHKLVDNVRGSTKVLGPNVAQVESTDTNGITSFDSNGFSIGNSNDFNNGSRNYVAWCWKAGDSVVANTTGTIDSQVSVNTDYGLSIVSYTGNNTAGATVGHNLGSVPKFILIKDRDSTSGWWAVYHASQGNTKGAYLNDDQGFSTQSFWNDTTPTSSVFTLGANANTNANGNDFMAYLWSEISGFSKFGSYTGTGAAGVSVTTGFKPRWVMIKETTNDNHWYIYDTRRGVTNILWASSSATESTIGSGDGTNQNAIEVSDTGFSIPHTLSGTNRNGGTFIYAAFGDRPGNNFDASNLSVATGKDNDSLIDTPSNYEAASGNNGGNYATWSPLAAQTSGSITLSNGNLDTTCGTTRTTAMSTFPLTGKTYWEITFHSGTYNYIGMTESTGWKTVANNNSGIKYTGYQSYSYGWSSGDGNLYKASNIVSSSPGTYSNGDVVGWAYDADNNTLKLYKNGTLQHTETGIADAQYFPALTHSGTATASTNFGQRPFAYTPPTDHVSVCSQNLDATIDDGSTVMTTDLYTGTGASHTRSGFSFSPDWVWIKVRSAGSSHRLYDTVRGAGKHLLSNGTSSEETHLTSLSGFTSDGFTLGANGEGSTNVNQSGSTYAAWCWDAGSSTVSNDDGSITANVRANPSAGFSIIQFLGNATSGATVGHGLSSAPELVIGKNRGGGDAWWVWFKAISSNASEFLKLNLTNTTSDTQYIANDTAPSSSVITLGSDYGWNSSQSPGSILYAFTPVSGYSAFGEYTGASDKFIYTGFKPQWLLLKSYAGDGFNWVIIDDKRGADTSNVSNKLYPNKSSSEDDDSRSGETKVVFFSNGFTFLDQGAETNSSSRSYVYAAFASHPLKHSRAGF